MELYLLRHGIPLEPDSWDGSDRTRPLTDSGRTQTHADIRALQLKRGLELDAIWSSPYLRAEETARIAATLLPSCDVLVTPALASGSDLLRSLPGSHGKPATWPARLLLVGHQPDLGLLIGHLTGSSLPSNGLGRAGSARLSGEFAPGTMKLEWLLTAEEALRDLFR